MTKRIKKIATKEELVQAQLKRDWVNLEDEFHLIPEPAYLFVEGESVGVGSLKDCRIKEVCQDGKVYLIEYTAVDNNRGNPIETPHSLIYSKWFEIAKKGENKINVVDFRQKDELELNFTQESISSLFFKAYSFGVNFEPEYQRGYVWSLEDKIDLIDSIFNNIEIGKFAFIVYDSKKCAETGLSYEILDGKQRLSTLCEFYEGRFTYHGYTFSELSETDRRHIKSYPVSVAELGNATEKQILEYFIKLNTNGRVMDQEHLNKVRAML